MDELLEQYKKIIDLGSIVSKSDKYGNITYVNDEFARISKYSKEELLGKPHSILRHPDVSKDTFKDLWKTIKKEKKPWTGILKNRAKDGSTYWVKTLVMPINEEDGVVTEYMSVRSDITELIQKEEKILKLLESSEKFVPKDFLQLLRVPDITKLKSGISTDIELTILFCDIRDFTKYSEENDSQQVFVELNDYFGRMEPIIKEHSGFIDKYIGDAIMAVFYTPRDAISCAVMMNETLTSLNHERLRRDLKKFDFGIGINTGIVTLGVVGGNRIDTTLIGDAVNVAARIEGLTKRTNSTILVSESSLSGIIFEKLEYREIRRVRLKGKAETVRIYEILDIFSDRNRNNPILESVSYDLPLRKIENQEYNEAFSLFKDISAKNPKDSIAKYWTKALERLLRKKG